MLNKIYKIYYILPNFDFLGKFGKGINRAFGLVGKKLLDRRVPENMLASQRQVGLGINTEPREELYVVSLTSFPARINDVWIAIECLLRQTFKPDKIILCLAITQFPDKKVPDSLKKLESRGLEVRFCEEDLRAHKKYLYTLKEFPSANIITVDDDAYNDNRMLESLYLLHKKYPQHIVSNRVHKMKFNKDKTLKPYRKWKHNISKENPSHLLFATGVGGVLYPPNSLHPEIFNIEVFKKICFLADDIWLKCMALKQGTKVVTNATYNKDPLTIRKSQMEKLVSANVLSGGNDKQLRDVCAHYNIDLLNYIDK
jgi:hypothetical protein